MVRSGLSGGSPPQLFTNFVVNSYYRYNDGYPTKYSTGDGIAPTWADDGNLYIILNDSFGGFQTMSYPRIAIAKLDGYTSALTGTNVHGFADVGSTFYLGGILSVGSMLYVTLAEGGQTLSGTVRQIIKSADHGLTWTPAAVGGTYPSPMWNGGNPGPNPIGFVQYGQAYTGNGPHNSGTYVYSYFAASTGSSHPVTFFAYLGRCSLANLPNLSAADWSWYQGGDGMVSGNWGSYGTASAVFMFTETVPYGPTFFLTGTGQYLPAFGCYLYTQSHYVADSAHSIVSIYASQTPWGTYTLVASIDTTSAGALFQATVAPNSLVTNGGRTLTLMTGGNYNLPDYATGQYCLHLMNASLS